MSQTRTAGIAGAITIGLVALIVASTPGPPGDVRLMGLLAATAILGHLWPPPPQYWLIGTLRPAAAMPTSGSS